MNQRGRQALGHLMQNWPPDYKIPVTPLWFHRVLYMADRQSWLETGWPMSGAERFVRNPSELLPDPDYHDGELSDYDVEVLDRLWTVFRGYSDYQLSVMVLDLPEWQGGVSEVTFEDILRANRVTEDIIQEIRERYTYFKAVELR